MASSVLGAVKDLRGATLPLAPFANTLTLSMNVPLKSWSVTYKSCAVLGLMPRMAVCVAIPGALAAIEADEAG